jgi:hypothetical protein
MTSMKRKNLFLALLSACLLVNSGCAAMMASWREHNCNYDGAYKTGMNAARKGEQMKTNFADPCEASTRAEVERGYREGFTAGAAGAVVIVPGA